MKRIVSIIVGVCVTMYSYCLEDKTDSLYYELYNFLVTQNYIPEDMRKEYTDYSFVVYAKELLKKEHHPIPDFQQTVFGVYEFSYWGLTGETPFILIKCDEEYKVYRKNQYSLIIRELLSIKKEHSELISDDLFEQYIEKITEINSDQLFFYEEIGKIKFTHYRFSIE